MNLLCYSPIYITVILALDSDSFNAKRALQKSHEKPQWLQWSEAFMGKSRICQQSNLVKLLNKITCNYLSDCTPVILYDAFTQHYDKLLIERLLRDFPVDYIHGQISTDYAMLVEYSVSTRTVCYSYILFVNDVMRCKDVIGTQEKSKVVVVSRSSQWRIFEFLSDEVSRHFFNLLVIVKSEHVMADDEVRNLSVYPLL